MSVISLKTRQKYGTLLAGNPFFVPPSFDSIATVTSTGSTGSVTFSSIPSTYQHLQIRITARCGRAASTDQLKLQFNSDTGANYVRHLLFGNGTSALASGSTAQNQIALLQFPASTEAANIFGTAIIDIHDYAITTKNTTVRFMNGMDNNSTAGRIYMGSGLWLNTAAVTSITIDPLNVANYAGGSTFALYGIRGA